MNVRPTTENQLKVQREQNNQLIPECYILYLIP